MSKYTNSIWYFLYFFIYFDVNIFVLYIQTNIQISFSDILTGIQLAGRVWKRQLPNSSFDAFLFATPLFHAICSRPDWRLAMASHSKIEKYFLSYTYDVFLLSPLFINSPYLFISWSYLYLCIRTTRAYIHYYQISYSI